ncbi:MAG: hypothetical protein RBU37_17965 [Myxococcota bacterium]|nr:hypothetical protein [Myxococcota bacterium]
MHACKLSPEHRQPVGGTGQAPNQQEVGGTGQAPNQQELGGTGQAPNQQELGGTGQAPNQQETAHTLAHDRRKGASCDTMRASFKAAAVDPSTARRAHTWEET